MLICGKSAMRASTRAFVDAYAESRSEPDNAFRDGGLYAEFKVCRNFLAKGFSNILNELLPIKHHIAA